MAVCRVMQSGVLFLLVFLLTRDLSNFKCLTRLDNQEVNSSGLAGERALSSYIGFKQPVRRKTSSGSHFGISLTPVAKVQLVRLTSSSCKFTASVQRYLRESWSFQSVTKMLG